MLPDDTEIGTLVCHTETLEPGVITNKTPPFRSAKVHKRTGIKGTQEIYFPPSFTVRWFESASSCEYGDKLMPMPKDLEALFVLGHRMPRQIADVRYFNGFRLDWPKQ